MSDTPKMPDEFISVKPSGISHAFDSGYAVGHGIDEAIMIRHFQHFIIGNEIRRHPDHYHDGKYWTYDRLEDFPKHFPYWTVRQVRRVLQSLITQGVIVVDYFDGGLQNRKSWFSFRDYDKFVTSHQEKQYPRKIEQKTSSQSIQADLPKTSNPPQAAQRICPNRQMGSDETVKSSYTTLSPTPLSEDSEKNSLKVLSLETEMQEKTPESRSPDEDTGIRAADATLLAGALDITLDASLVKKKKRSEFPKRVIDLAEQMITMMQDHEPLYKPPKNLQAFLIETDLMLRLDKIPPEEILSVLEWTLCDNFWKGKIFKPNPAKYLRDKFLTLRNTMSPPAIKKERKFAPTSNDARALEERKEHKKNAL